MVGAMEREGAFVVTIKDNGPPFDPTQDRDTGDGRGLVLMKSVAEIDYRRSGDANLLDLHIVDREA